MVYRPFLYFDIHHPHDQSFETEQLIRPLIRKGLANLVEATLNLSVEHRHHGTWLMARQSFTSALLLSAGRLSGLGVVDEESCKQSIRHTLSTLRFWEAEAPDLKASRLILQDVSKRVDVYSAG